MVAPYIEPVFTTAKVIYIDLTVAGFELASSGYCITGHQLLKISYTLGFAFDLLMGHRNFQPTEILFAQEICSELSFFNIAMPWYSRKNFSDK